MLDIIHELYAKREFDLASRLSAIERESNCAWLDEQSFKNHLSQLKFENDKLRLAVALGKKEIEKLNKVIDGLNR